MNPSERIAELEREVARLERELARSRESLPPRGENPAVARLLADRTVLANLPDIILLLDADLRVLYINRVLPGRSIDEFVGRSVLEHLAPSAREIHRTYLERAWTTGEPQLFQTRSSSGSVWDNRVVAVREEGSGGYLLATSVDITERTRAEDALREHASKLRYALDATGMGTWVREGDLVRWDENLCRILAVDPAEAPTDPDAFLRFIHPDDRPRLRDQIEQFRHTGRYDKVESRIVRPDGSVRHTIIKASIELADDGSIARSYGGVFDVTEQKLLEERVRQSEKMDAIGHLTAGIAHNFNNILGVILPNVELCRRHASPEVQARLDHIMHAAERGAEMVRQLMIFARRDVDDAKQPTDLRACARRTAEICRATFDPSIRIHLLVPETPANVRANAGQIEQMLLNICLNARDAFEQTRARHPEIWIELSSTETGDVRIRVRDNGPGMDEATRAHVFDPFFTTKTADRGTGLGLATVLAVVTDHGGVIRCLSQPTQGTTFEIDLPATNESTVVAAPASPVQSVGGTETILVADDEPLVREATRDLLELGGYRVLETSDGPSTVALVERERENLSLVLLDRSMPGLSGEQTLKALNELAPTLPVIMLSGHLAAMEGKERASAMLTKPTSAAVLLGTVREILDRPKSRREGA